MVECEAFARASVISAERAVSRVVVGNKLE